MKFSLKEYVQNRLFFVIAGPCVLEEFEETLQIAQRVKTICEKLCLAPIFKASFDKANRTSIESKRGPGLNEGMAILKEIAHHTEMPILTDIHLPEQASVAAEVCQILQIPAFLCRQTDLILAAAKYSSVIHVKKGQFLSPWDTEHIAGKVRRYSSAELILTERGSTFGYGNLVVDMRSFPIMKKWADFVGFDVTHALQLPGAGQGKTSGQREFIPYLANAAMATGAIDGIFMEVHPEPWRSPSDAENILPLHELEKVLTTLVAIKKAIST